MLNTNLQKVHLRLTIPLVVIPHLKMTLRRIQIKRIQDHRLPSFKLTLRTFPLTESHTQTSFPQPQSNIRKLLVASISGPLHTHRQFPSLIIV
jgi:hypothetical protein